MTPFSYRSIHRIFAVLFFVICISIVYYSRELGELRGAIGDVIIIMFLYSVVQGIYQMTPWKVMIIVLVLGFCVEFLQYLDFIRLIGWETSPIMRLIFGSIYDPMDLVYYTIGGVCIYLLDIYIIRAH